MVGLLHTMYVYIIKGDTTLILDTSKQMNATYTPYSATIVLTADKRSVSFSVSKSNCELFKVFFDILSSFHKEKNFKFPLNRQ